MNKCKGCQWYGKPYWSIINPCDNCPRENTNVEIITRWQDPAIEEYKKEITRLNNIIEELDKLISIKIIREVDEPDYHIDLSDMVEIKIKLLELKENNKDDN